MPKTKEEKVAELKTLSDNLRQAQAVVFTTFKDVPVKDIEVLRRDLRQSGVTYQVIKRNLLARALQEAQLTGLPLTSWRDNVGVAFGSTDEVTPAKKLYAFAKKFAADNKEKIPKGLVLEGGILEGKIVDTAAVSALALLPGKEELLALLVGSLASPLRGTVTVLQGNLRGLVQALQALAQRGA